MAPDKVNSVTNKRLITAMVFMEGYYTSLAEMCEPPIDTNDVKTQVLSTGFQYIWRLIDKESSGSV